MLVGDSLKIGGLSLPIAAVIGVGAYLVAYAAGRFVRLKDSADRQRYTDLLLAPVIPFILGWKLSLIATDAADLLESPSLLLFSTGSWINLLIGALIAAGWMVYRWLKTAPGKDLSRSLAVGFGVLVLSGGLSLLLFTGTAAESDNAYLEFVELTDQHGRPWTPEDVDGPVLINIWASWCPPCRAEMPMLATLDSRSIIALNAAATEKSPNAGKEWLESEGFSLPVVYDYEGEAMRVWNVEALPTSIVLDSEGRIVVRKTGAISRRWAKSALRRAARRR